MEAIENEHMDILVRNVTILMTRLVCEQDGRGRGGVHSALLPDSASGSSWVPFLERIYI